MRIQSLPPPSRCMFWCVAPFLLATIVGLPALVKPPGPTGWITLGAIELVALCTLFGFYDPVRFKWCLRVVGAIVFLGYLSYLVFMIRSGHWLSVDGHSTASAFQAMLGLIVFGYPGFMYAVFGRFTWKPDFD